MEQEPARSAFLIILVSGNVIFNRLNINGLCLALFFVPLLLERHLALRDQEAGIHTRAGRTVP